MSDAPDSLPAAVGCYMQRHTFTCWKLPVTQIFSGFQKTVSESRQIILNFAAGRTLTLTWCQRGQAWEQQRSCPLLSNAHVNRNFGTDGSLGPTKSHHCSHFCLLVFFLHVTQTRTLPTFWIWWQTVWENLHLHRGTHCPPTQHKWVRTALPIPPIRNCAYTILVPKPRSLNWGE